MAGLAHDRQSPLPYSNTPGSPSRRATNGPEYPDRGRPFEESEVHLRAELNNPCRDALHSATDRAEGSRLNAAVHGSRLRVEMPEQVEELRAEFQSCTFPETERFID